MTGRHAPTREPFILVAPRSMRPESGPRPLNLVERPVVEVESEVPRSKHFEPFRRAPFGRVRNADHHDVRIHRIRAEALAEDRVAWFRIEIAGEVRRAF